MPPNVQYISSSNPLFSQCQKGTDGSEKQVTEDQAQFENGKLQYGGEKAIEFRDEIGSDTVSRY